MFWGCCQGGPFFTNRVSRSGCCSGDIQQQTAVACLFIHDLQVVREIADEVAVLFQGEVIRQGPVREALQEPLDNSARRLLHSVPEMRRGWLEEQHPLIGSDTPA